MTEFFIHIEGGKPVSERVLNTRLAELEDGKYKVTIEKGRKRSLPQNAYYHSVVCQIVRDVLREAGYNEVKTAADAHEILKYRFLKRQLPNEDGEFVEMVRSTKQLSTIEFMAYIEDIVQWVAQTFNIVIPAPGQQTEFF